MIHVTHLVSSRADVSRSDVSVRLNVVGIKHTQEDSVY